jgi:AcrR family transcriptional regulator
MAGRRQKVIPEQIIDAAAAVFARKGFFTTAMADIASAAGIGKGTLYVYFPSKDDLFFAVFQRFMEKTRQAADACGQGARVPASRRLMTIGDAVTGAWPQLKRLYSLTLEFWAAAASSRHRDRFKQAFSSAYGQYRTLVADVLRQGIADGEFRRDVAVASVAAVLVGAWDALLLQAWFDDDFDPVAAGRDFLRVLLHGLLR